MKIEDAHTMKIEDAHTMTIAELVGLINWFAKRCQWYQTEINRLKEEA